MREVHTHYTRNSPSSNLAAFGYSTIMPDIPAVEPAHRENETNLTAEVGQIGRMAPVAAVHGLADGVAVRAGAAGLRALGGNLDDHRIRAHYLLNAAARNRKKLSHSTSCNADPTKCECLSILLFHAKCGRTHMRGSLQKVAELKRLSPCLASHASVVISSVPPMQ
jgi:hypothetical protein